MTRSRLLEERERLQAQLMTIRSQWDVTQGALQLLDILLREDESIEPALSLVPREDVG